MYRLIRTLRTERLGIAPMLHVQVPGYLTDGIQFEPGLLR